MTFDTRQGRVMTHDIYACHVTVTVSHTICLHFNQQIFYALKFPAFPSQYLQLNIAIPRSGGVFYVTNYPVTLIVAQ